MFEVVFGPQKRFEVQDRSPSDGCLGLSCEKSQWRVESTLGQNLVQFQTKRALTEIVSLPLTVTFNLPNSFFMTYCLKLGWGWARPASALTICSHMRVGLSSSYSPRQVYTTWPLPYH